MSKVHPVCFLVKKCVILGVRDTTKFGDIKKYKTNITYIDVSANTNPFNIQKQDSFLEQITKMSWGITWVKNTKIIKSIDMIYYM